MTLRSPLWFAAILLLAIPSVAPAYTTYVATTGGPGPGTKGEPRDIVSGISHLNAGDTLHIALGSYFWDVATYGPVNIPAGSVVEGGFDASWHKDLSSPTTISIQPVMTTFNNGGNYVGIDMVGLVFNVMRDLTISALGPMSPTETVNSRGVSVYAVRMQSCLGYLFERVSFVSSAATSGINGVSGATGHLAEAGTNGGAGTGTGGVCGLGGAGGRAWTNVIPAGPTSCSEAGANGSGGSGRIGGNGGAGGSGATTGIGASGGNGGATAAGLGGTAGPGGQGDNCSIGQDGQKGLDGVDGLDGTPASSPAGPTVGAAQRSTYFVPFGQSASGNPGSGGAGGGGGGGGAGTVGAGCQNLPGGGGGGGGGGGEGGGGGTGGWGGGSSYGVYLVSNGGMGEFRCCTFNPGAKGSGGSGGFHGIRGVGAPGRLGQSSGGARGGDGGKGGYGGMGGWGTAGGDGESVGMQLASGTAPTVSGGADADGDGWPNLCDNCPSTANANQKDSNDNGVGDACDVLLDVQDAGLPFAFETVRPNPTRTAMTIGYTVAREADVVSLRILDAQGRVVRTLVDGARAAGHHAVNWNLVDAHGARVRAGVYFARLDGIAGTQVRRIVVVM